MSDADTFIRNVAVECLPGVEKELSIHQEQVGDVGTVVWDAALVLSYYLQTPKVKDLIHGKKIVELGSGTGIVGLVASLCGAAEVLVTDLPDLLPLLNRNIETNKENIHGIVTAAQLTWGKKEHLASIQSFIRPDCILIADCVYYRDAVRPLAQSVFALLNSSNSSVALCSYEDRDTPDKAELQIEFRRILQEEFGLRIAFIPFHEMHPEFRAKDIHIFKISHKTNTEA